MDQSRTSSHTSRFRPRSRTGWVLGVMLVLVIAASGTTLFLRSVRTQVESPRRLLVIGIDGLDWNILAPLMQRGEVPHLTRLAEAGVRGHLTTLQPTLSPVIWTTMATGKGPDAHGIVNFTTTDIETGEERLFTSRDRKVKALWNILSDAGRTVNVIGWWNTWPAEPINGVMVSQYASLEQGRQVWKGSVHENWPAQCWPEEYFDEILPLVRAVKARYPAVVDPAGPLPPALRPLFPRLPEGLTPFEARLVSDSVWAFGADETYASLAEKVLQERPADVTLVYLGSPDVAGHRFFRHYRPAAFRHQPREAAVAAFRDVIPASYRFVDRLVGRLIEAAGPGTDVLVLSDHGMGPVNTSKDLEAAFAGSNERYRLAAVNSGHHLAAEPGVLLAAGPSIASAPSDGAWVTWRRSGFPVTSLRALGSVFDVTPTVLHLVGLPVGQDMEGSVMVSLLSTARRSAHRIAYVETYEDGRRQARPFDGMDAERLRQLKSLGYVK